jgi:hypothetical protein
VSARKAPVARRRAPVAAAVQRLEGVEQVPASGRARLALESFEGRGGCETDQDSRAHDALVGRCLPRGFRFRSARFSSISIQVVPSGS